MNDILSRMMCVVRGGKPVISLVIKVGKRIFRTSRRQFGWEE